MTSTTPRRRRFARGDHGRRPSLPPVPVPLAALLGAVLVLAITWALLTPPFQAPDEHYHVGYVQALVEGPGIPGKPDRSPFATEQWEAQNAANSDQTAGTLEAKPEWSPLEWRRWQARDRQLPAAARSDGGGADNRAAGNPPLFYLYDAVPYVATSGSNFFARVTAMRIAASLWLLVTVIGAWLLAGEIFGRDRLLQLVTAAVAGLFPMVTYVSAQVGPDTMMYALWSLALWLGVRVLKRGLTAVSAVALLGVAGLAIVTKATSYALAPPVLLVLAIGLWRMRSERVRAVRLALAAGAAIVLPVLAWVIVARLLDHHAAAQLAAASDGGRNSREFVSYLWQYYLPRLPFMAPYSYGAPGLPAFNIWIEQGWGAFGWLETRFPAWAYLLFTTLTLAVAALAIARLVATRRRVDRAVTVFLLLAAGTLLAGLHWADYGSLASGTGNVMQGRYVFPLVAVGGLAVAQAVTWLSGPRRLVGAGIVLGGLLTLQLFAMGLVAVRFYA